LISIISKSNSLSNKENYLQKLKEEASTNNEEIERIRNQNTYLEHQLLEVEKTGKLLDRQKQDKENNIVKFEDSNKKLKVDIEKFKNDIISMEKELKEIQVKKNTIDVLQQSINYYTQEIEKLKK
jgi:chromosome segregation ATPase